MSCILVGAAASGNCCHPPTENPSRPTREVLLLAEYLLSPPGGLSLYMNVKGSGFSGNLWFLGLGPAHHELCVL